MYYRRGSKKVNRGAGHRPVGRKRGRAARAFAVVAIALGVSLLGAIAVSAHTKRWQTTVTIDSAVCTSIGCFTSGSVESRKARCVRGRKVKVYRVGEAGPVGQATANADGSWEAEFPQAGPGTSYYAKVPRVRLGRRGGSHRHICRADRSPTVASVDI